MNKYTIKHLSSMNHDFSNQSTVTSYHLTRSSQKMSASIDLTRHIQYKPLCTLTNFISLPLEHLLPPTDHENIHLFTSRNIFWFLFQLVFTQTCMIQGILLTCQSVNTRHRYSRRHMVILGRQQEIIDPTWNVRQID